MFFSFEQFDEKVVCPFQRRVILAANQDGAS